MVSRDPTPDTLQRQSTLDAIAADFHPIYKTSYSAEQRWARAPKEVACALAASVLVSPLVSVIDKCMVQDIPGIGAFFRAAGSACSDMVYKPKQFFGGLSFRLTVVVYFGTYAVANLSEWVLDEMKVKQDTQRKQVKVSAASVANVGLLAWRDSVFARVFANPGAAKKSTPMRTIGMFAMRDSLTMGATFYGAPLASNYLKKERDWHPEVAEFLMALTIPAITQVLTAPIHIHAMDYFNRPGTLPLSERIDNIKSEFPKISLFRALRILPAFGIGSYSNNKFREFFIKQDDLDLLLAHRVTQMMQHMSLSEMPAPSVEKN
mmetsp:Transcript_10139/g.23463  ORF Transcript_10139/g.23463 Transcript_10139/m.23463 type:complete len:320 (-) Transcript_10139:205-1164(-)|eukprot:CAMPEP_0116837196 /NCGR_PEP_ID=MMETSP0418-20121206/8517_1 /TAXON_ID=1158023 /ORGANISM="Astrosyne radiata, Strain 13vi08-1A" /LENGTH=319 /DNA_ID=CAMNT_0004467049 /DNA_START=83 /DNA_END=1042 /DNA_ORIENTATION=+